MSKENSATKGFAILSAAGVLNKILSVAYVPVLLQIVGDVGYGIYSAGYQIYVFIYVLTNSGFPVAISKLEAELIAHEDYRNARRSLLVSRLMFFTYGLVMTAITAIFARQITNAIGYERSYLVILALSPTMFFSAISCTYRGYFNGNSNMKPTAVSQVIEQFLNVVLSLLFAYLLIPYGIEWACAGATVGTTLGALGSSLYLSSAYKKNRHFLEQKTHDGLKVIRYRYLARRLLSYTIPLAFNSVIVYGGNLVDLWNTKQRLLAAGFSSVDSYVKYGVLGKYTQLLNVPLAITAALYVASLPSFSSAVALDDNKLLKSHIDQAFRICLLLAVPAAVGLGVLSRPVFLMLFSEKYVDGWYLMSIGSVVIILVSIVQVQSGILQSINKTRLATIAMIIGIIVKILINYFLIAIPSINIIGAVAGTIVCYFVAIEMSSFYIKKFIPVKVRIKKHMGKPFVASTAMGVLTAISYKACNAILQIIMGVYMANAISVIFSIAIGAVVYGLIMLKLGGITSEDIKMIPFSRKLMKYIPASLLPLAKEK